MDTTEQRPRFGWMITGIVAVIIAGIGIVGWTNHQEDKRERAQRITDELSDGLYCTSYEVLYPSRDVPAGC